MASGNVAQLTLSLSGDTIAYATTDSVALWSAGEGRELLRIGTTGRVQSVDFSANGRYVAICSDQVRIYSPSDGAFIRSLEPTTGTTAVKFCSASNMIAVATAGAVSIWSPESGERCECVEGFDSVIPLLAFPSPHTVAAYVPTAAPRIVVRRAEDGAVLREIPIGFGETRFSPSGNLVGCLDGRRLRVWSVLSGALAGALEAPDFGSGVAFSHDDSLVASVGAEARIWRLAGGAVTASYSVAPSSASREFGVCQPAFSGDGSSFAVSVDSRISIWKIRQW